MVDRTGEQRGRLTFLSWAGTGTRTGRTYWFVSCECGERRIIRADARQLSCGCANDDALRRPGRFKQGDRYHNERLVEVDGRTMNITAAARHTGVDEKTIRKRILRGWPQEKWFDPPRLPYREKKRWLRRKRRKENADQRAGSSPSP